VLKKAVALEDGGGSILIRSFICSGAGSVRMDAFVCRVQILIGRSFIHSWEGRMDAEASSVFR
jgi:hypothetical protein